MSSYPRPYVLDDVRADHVIVECAPCQRRGQFATARLKATYGGHIMLPDLKDKLATCKAHSEMGACSARFAAETVVNWKPTPTPDSL